MDVPTCADTLSRPVTNPGLPRLGEPPRLSVILVNYVHWDDTARVVRQLRASDALRRGQAEVVIVDNHSPPHPLIPRLRRSPGLSLRRWKDNRGFARAVNEGCRLAQGDWFLLLNPDTSVPPGFLDQVLDRIDRLASSTGIVGFRLHSDDGSRQLSTGRYPHLVGTLARLLLPRHVRKYTPPPVAGPCEVDWVTGCCLLLRRDCFTDLGGLDPDYFLYYEDVDLCLRARQMGWKVQFDPTAGIIHHHPLHSRRVPASIRLITRHALMTYARKHWPGWQVPVLGGIIRLEAMVRRVTARMRGDQDASEVFAQLDRLVVDLLADQQASARARLLSVVRQQEQQRASALGHRHPQPQPSRPAGPLPGECPAAYLARCAGTRGR